MVRTGLDTKVENPVCRALPGSINRYTEDYDSRILRRFRLHDRSGNWQTPRRVLPGYPSQQPWSRTEPRYTRSASLSHEEGFQSPVTHSFWAVEPDDRRGCSVSPLPCPGSIFYSPSDVPLPFEHKSAQRVRSTQQFSRRSPSSREVLESTPKPRTRSRTDEITPSNQGSFYSPVSQRTTKNENRMTPQKKLYFSPPSGRAQTQADRQLARSNSARSDTTKVTAAAQARSQAVSEATLQELRKQHAAAHRLRGALERSLVDIRDEHLMCSKVFGFLMEIRKIKASSKPNGLEGVQSLTEARQKRRQLADKSDVVSQALFAQVEDLAATCKAVDEMAQRTRVFVDTLRGMEKKLENGIQQAKVGINIDDQCLSLADASHVDVASVERRTASPTLRRSVPTDLIEEAAQVLSKSMTARKHFKRRVTTTEQKNQELAEKTLRSLKHAIAQEQHLVTSLETRSQALFEERTRIDRQVGILKQGLEERMKEQDIVSKRLKLRQQRPLLGGDHDMVCTSLLEEHAALTKAVETMSARSDTLSDEQTRLSETVQSVAAELQETKRLLQIDQYLLSRYTDPNPEEV
ncbi:hypothetical protein DIPPA_10882 [Diplonema papillatum]|nr:hypothetical protein DIPPA_10882 [Diplonema papillatum]